MKIYIDGIPYIACRIKNTPKSDDSPPWNVTFRIHKSPKLDTDSRIAFMGGNRVYVFEDMIYHTRKKERSNLYYYNAAFEKRETYYNE